MVEVHFVNGVALREYFKGSGFFIYASVSVSREKQKKVGATYVCELCQKDNIKNGPVHLDKNSRYQTESTLSEVSDGVEVAPVTLQERITISSQVACRPGMPSRKLRILCLHGFRQNASNFKGRTASLAKKLKDIVELVFIDAPNELPFIYQPRPAETLDCSVGLRLQPSPPPLENCKKKFAWLVAAKCNSLRGADWAMADEPFDPLQYQQQTDGFEVSLSYLNDIFTQMGPFDGVLGFSQGAAMVASLSVERGKLDGKIDFRFAILCSGFALHLEQLEPGSIDCPSLHIFGNSQGKDRQIACQASTDLANLFKQSCSVTVRHESGHIIPTQPPYIDRIKAFLLDFF
ncbi:hypothetical protein IFM89_015316 [Coptis chinensis]|uniref:Serine hydrolase domain-containing protein n=1 Tax=Coptis chinensis TaxID=261450 RepID=A0A835MBH8_9MAGN|nr:hypothetical protein IFM89_015316 [Coptis chinensis]